VYEPAVSTNSPYWDTIAVNSVLTTSQQVTGLFCFLLFFVVSFLFPNQFLTILFRIRVAIETGAEGDARSDAEEVSSSGPDVLGTLSKPSPVLSCFVPCSVLADGGLARFTIWELTA
jgi:hypothetical protein